MGTFVDTTLNSNEVIRYEAKVSWWSMLGYLLIGTLLLPVMGIGLLFYLAAFLRRWSTELAITDRKVVAKSGVIARQSIEVLLPKVESVQVHQGILGRLLNYGTIIICGTGNSKAPIRGISDPLIFRRRFMEVQQLAVA
jgi:uncharacterized membrane protein YdbT with pleckstrin-like domain